MKKIIAIVLVVAALLSLTSCLGGGKYNKYKELIDCIEKNDFEGAYDELSRIEDERVNGAASDEGEKTIVTVDISTENWQEYFEIVSRDEIEYNEFGEIADMYKVHYITLKSGYEMAEEQFDDGIAVEYNYITEWRYVEIDKVKGVLNIGDIVTDGNRETEEHLGEMTTIYQSETSLENSRTWSEGMQAVGDDFEIVRIQGTLYLEK